ncbi:OLC1v1037257C1 [Oldenlandia corymbosa var. corymbosa]|uniref:OLC1v1037257C1 n=1 Tax=Oldenlandia corymbosa var. corymbosa TaxID=529605 RepID=A0AAV1D0H3_OLDCO|nr:OLC1v1037257C1 [Oldenlandia corymbosa var. corymbosa]
MGRIRRMGKLKFGRVLGSLCLSSSGSSGSCLCFSNNHQYGSGEEHELENKPLITAPEKTGQLVKIRDVISAPPTLALQLKPKMVVLKVSMHCNGCARKVEKHIKKIEGVTSYEVDLETKMVVVIGDIVPFEVLESVSKVKTAELLTSPAAC